MEQINMLRFHVCTPNDKSWCFVFGVKTLKPGGGGGGDEPPLVETVCNLITIKSHEK